jgi:hypothetical protein
MSDLESVRLFSARRMRCETCETREASFPAAQRKSVLSDVVNENMILIEERVSATSVRTLAIAALSSYRTAVDDSCLSRDGTNNNCDNNNNI